MLRDQICHGISMDCMFYAIVYVCLITLHEENMSTY